jgi:hypothetical protein
MPAVNRVLSVYGDLIVSFKCNNEALDIATMNACVDASAVLVTEAAMVAPSDLTIPEQQRTDTALDATRSTKRVRLGLPNPEKTVVIGVNLGEKLELELTSFLWDSVDIFSWTPSDMLGVPRELAKHSLDVSKTAKPIKQKLRRFAKGHKEVIRVEIIKLLAAGFIRECKNPVWLANPVLVPKKTGQWRMCIDYTALNKHCPKDPLPLSRIDHVVVSTAGSVLLCFLDCYTGYYQIPRQDDVHNAARHLLLYGHDIQPQKCWSDLPTGHPELLEVLDW